MVPVRSWGQSGSPLPITVRRRPIAEIGDKAYKLNDSGGLYHFVSPKAHKSWRFKYRFDSKEQLLTIGS
jgi:hypothetical protein